jgi:hypothetical protein
MIIDDLDFVSVALAPHETDSPLIVDSDAVLALAAAPRNPQRKTTGAARSRGSRCFIPNTQAPRGESRPAPGAGKILRQVFAPNRIAVVQW